MEPIDRQQAIDAVDAIGHIATMPDGDKCIRRSAVKYTLSMLPSAKPKVRFNDKDHVWIDGKQYISLPRFQQAVKEAQSNAQPEIIHCNECRHRFTHNCVANTWVSVFGYTVDDNFYCGFAERRTDD